MLPLFREITPFLSAAAGIHITCTWADGKERL
jgi:hypothetical protein